MERPLKKARLEPTDTTELEDSVWLVKLSSAVAKGWEKAADGAYIGTLLVPPGGFIEGGADPQLDIDLVRYIKVEQQEEEEHLAHCIFNACHLLDPRFLPNSRREHFEEWTNALKASKEVKDAPGSRVDLKWLDVGALHAILHMLQRSADVVVVDNLASFALGAAAAQAIKGRLVKGLPVTALVNVGGYLASRWVVFRPTATGQVDIADCLNTQDPHVLDAAEHLRAFIRRNTMSSFMIKANKAPLSYAFFDTKLSCRQCELNLAEISALRVKIERMRSEMALHPPPSKDELEKNKKRLEEMMKPGGMFTPQKLADISARRVKIERAPSEMALAATRKEELEKEEKRLEGMMKHGKMFTRIPPEAYCDVCQMVLCKLCWGEVHGKKDTHMKRSLDEAPREPQRMYGTVERECDLRVNRLGKDVTMAFRNRSKEVNAKTRHVAKLKDVKMPSRPMMAPTKSKDEMLARKKTRATEEEAVDLIMRCFEEEQFWNLDQLSKATDQPINFLRELLPRFAIQHRTGPHRNHYELKTERPSVSQSQ